MSAIGSANYAVIEATTGRILRTGHCSRSALDLQGMDDEVVIETDGTISDDTHYWREGWQRYPDRPTDATEFDYHASAWRLKSDAERAAEATQAARDAARTYLADTDWYVTRAAETGKPVPDDVLTARAAARDLLSETTPL